jgi:hypothetical protein
MNKEDEGTTKSVRKHIVFFPCDLTLLLFLSNLSIGIKRANGRIEWE